MNISEIYRKLEDYFYILSKSKYELKHISINSTMVEYEFYNVKDSMSTNIIMIPYYKIDQYLEEFDKFDNKYRKEV